MRAVISCAKELEISTSICSREKFKNPKHTTKPLKEQTGLFLCERELTNYNHDPNNAQGMGPGLWKAKLINFKLKVPVTL